MGREREKMKEREIETEQIEEVHSGGEILRPHACFCGWKRSRHTHTHTNRHMHYTP